MAWGVPWDEAEPVIGDPANLAHEDMWNIKKSVRERIAVDHHAPTGDDDDTWEHLEFTAKIGQGLLANREAAAAGNKGKIWYATDTGGYSLSTGSAWVSVSGGSEYATGTVTVTNASADVVGSGTDFTLLTVGDVFWIDGATRYYSIKTLTDATNLVLDENYEGTTGGGKSYHVGRVLLGEQWLPRAGGEWFFGKLGSALDANSKNITGLAAHASAGDAVRQEHTTINPIEHADASVTLAKLAADINVSEWAIGTYVGDGNDDRDLNIGLDLTSGEYWGMIYPKDTGVSGNSPTFFTSQDTAGYSFVTRENYVDDAVIGTHATGFTLGTRADVNNNSKNYIYIVLKLS